MHISIKSITLPAVVGLLDRLLYYLKELLFVLLIALVALIVINIVIKLIRLIRHLREPFLFLEITPPANAKVSSITTTNLFNQLIGLQKQESMIDRLTLKTASISLEIVSSKKEGIRYLVRTPKYLAVNIEKAFRSYLPSCKIKESTDYISENASFQIVQYKQSKHFALPLKDHPDLSKHDPVNYLTGNIKHLKENELMTLQLVLTPLSRSGNFGNIFEANRISKILRKNNQVDWSAAKLSFRIALIFMQVIDLMVRILMIPFFVIAEFVTDRAPKFPETKFLSDKTSPEDLEFSELAKTKLSEPLFSAGLRSLVIAEKQQSHDRKSGIIASLFGFAHQCGQALVVNRNILGRIALHMKYKNRLGGQMIITSTEAGSIFHFPYTEDVYNDDMQKIRSRELPAPLSVKNQSDFDVVFGKNTYSNSSVDIGLTDDDRSRHVYMIGQTGSSKTTIIYHMADDDINRGRGVAVVDPHGDLAEDLLNRIPDRRAEELIYLDPYDIKYPIGINLLELSEGLDEDDLELEKELVCESVVAIFRRVFFKDDNVDAHRIEYILRNAIYSAFCQEDYTIFTVYDLLNNKDYRKQAIKNIKDENLLNFWKNEFGKAGDYQHVKMAGGVTSKIGRFLFSPIAKRILEQPKSTISFDEILEKGKILICNLAEGKLGEDTSQLLGATIIAKIYQAAMRRVRIEKDLRQPFYLFVDEFQNFATSSFTKVLSGGRKFGLRITIAEQSTAQQHDQNITNVVLANTGTAICFRTASPVDERLMLPQFSPAVGPGDIANLPRFRFYIKMAAIEPEEPFSGITLPILAVKSPGRIKCLKETSRKNYAIEYSKPETKTTAKEKEKPTKNEPAIDIGSLT